MKQFREKKPLMKQIGAQTSFDETFRGEEAFNETFWGEEAFRNSSGHKHSLIQSFDERGRGEEAFDETIVRGTNIR
jgi:hypothetical protein